MTPGARSRVRGKEAPLLPKRPFTAASLAPALALAVWIATTTLGCAAMDRVEHGIQAKDYAGTPLSPDRGRGRVRFSAELQYDPTLVSYVRENGRPDYFYIVDHQKLYLFYVRDDRAAMFERVAMEASEVRELGRIPGSMLDLLPAQEKQRIVAKRATSQRQAQRQAKHSRARIARTPSRATSPASQAPAGLYLGGFEPSSIIDRMRAPLTAADPGVRSWGKTTLRGGKTAWNAKVGGTHYEVRDDRVAFTVQLPASRGQLPPSARLAIKRVNDAIFAARADAVTQQMMGFAERAAADRSGRTAFAQRVAGRTIRMGRRVSDGVFAYSIHP